MADLAALAMAIQQNPGLLAKLIEGETTVKTYAIDSDYNVTVFNTKGEAEASFPTEATERVIFSDLESLVAATAGWKTSRLIELWNSIPGNSEVKKFTDRPTGLGRIWRSIERQLSTNGNGTSESRQEAASANGPGEVVPEGQPAPTKRAKSQRKAKKAAKVQAKAKAKSAKVAATNGNGNGEAKPKAEAREGTKKERILAMLRREKGVTLDQIMEETGWQAHTTRAFISRAIGKDLGLAVERIKRADGRTAYQIAS